MLGTYSGELKDSLPHGRGMLVFDNIKFEGEFRDGLRNGKGLYTYPGGHYEGTWKDDKNHGSGVGKWDNATSDEFMEWDNGELTKHSQKMQDGSTFHLV